MKHICALFLSALCFVSEPKAKDATLDLNDNIVFWSYGSQKQKLDVLWKFVQVDSSAREFTIDDNFGNGIDSELVNLSACMDRRWYPAYL